MRMCVCFSPLIRFDFMVIKFIFAQMVVKMPKFSRFFSMGLGYANWCWKCPKFPPFLFFFSQLVDFGVGLWECSFSSQVIWFWWFLLLISINRMPLVEWDWRIYRLQLVSSQYEAQCEDHPCKVWFWSFSVQNPNF